MWVPFVVPAKRVRVLGGDFTSWCSHDANVRACRETGGLVSILRDGRSSESWTENSNCLDQLKSLILAQIERWRHALHMQVERQRGGNPGGERRTGE